MPPDNIVFCTLELVLSTTRHSDIRQILRVEDVVEATKITLAGVTSAITAANFLLLQASARTYERGTLFLSIGLFLTVLNRLEYCTTEFPQLIKNYAIQPKSKKAAAPFALAKKNPKII